MNSLNRVSPLLVAEDEVEDEVQKPRKMETSFVADENTPMLDYKLSTRSGTFFIDGEFFTSGNNKKSKVTKSLNL